MSKLMMLKKIVTVPDAAKYLSGILDEEVSSVDLFQFATEGKLKLSFNFKSTKATKGILEGNETVYLDGIYDIWNPYNPYDFGNLKLVKYYPERHGGDYILYVNHDCGLFVIDENGECYTVYRNESDEVGEEWFSALFDGELCGYSHITDNSCVVVKVDNLKEFEKNFIKKGNDLKPANSENQKAITSLLKMVITMATELYDYDPKANKSGTVKQLVEDAEELGIAIDPDTVRSWLKKAAELLPQKND